MGLKNFIKGEMLEVIEWHDDSRETLTWRFPDNDNAIKNGAQLIVRESQAAQFMYLGQFGDTFSPGRHTLSTEEIPILTKLRNWKFGYNSPFKADVYYVNTRLFTGNKWGTANPVMMRDEDLGVVRARAFGSYDFRIINIPLFLREVAGSDHNFTLDEFSETMRSRLVSVFSDALATAKIPIIDAASRYDDLGNALLPLINPAFSSNYGIEITSFIVENIGVPPEVGEAIDKRSSLSAIGNLDDYVKYQMAQGMATGNGGAGSVAAEMAVGLGLAKDMVQSTSSPLSPPPLPGAPAPAPSQGELEVFDPATVAQMLNVSEADLMPEIENGNLQAKKIGPVYRITREALDAFLAE